MSPKDIASTLARIFKRPARAEVAERQTEALFLSQGMTHPLPRMCILDGFNEEWITFESHADDVLRGQVELDAVLRALASLEIEVSPTIPGGEMGAPSPGWYRSRSRPLST